MTTQTNPSVTDQLKAGLNSEIEMLKKQHYYAVERLQRMTADAVADIERDYRSEHFGHNAMAAANEITLIAGKLRAIENVLAHLLTLSELV